MRRATLLGLMLGLPALPLSLYSSASSGPSFDISGRIQVDYSLFEGAHNEHNRGSEWEVRRARMGFSHKSKQGWSAEMEIDVDQAASEVSITDAYVSYAGRFADVTFGRMKEPFGLENTTGSGNINTIERSVVTEAFKPGRSFGLALGNAADQYTWNLGLFRNSEDEHGLDGYAVTGRVTYNPLVSDTRAIHLGLSVSQRDLLGETFRINESLEVNPADSIIESPRVVGDKITQYSLEGALVFGSFSAQAEWMQLDLTPLSAEPVDDYSYNGFYVLVSYFLTGETRNYRNGSFGRVRPNSNSGAWELVMRFSNIELDDIELDDAPSRDVAADTWMLGVNYYASGRAKFAINYASSDVVSPKPEEHGPAKALSVRAQYSF